MHDNVFNIHMQASTVHELITADNTQLKRVTECLYCV